MNAGGQALERTAFVSIYGPSTEETTDLSDIAKARDEITAIADQLSAGGSEHGDQLREIVQRYMFRERAARRMPVHSRRVTPAVRERIIDLAEGTMMHSAEIAIEVGVNPGRVSEVLHGR
jgi:hypothetical protein